MLSKNLSNSRGSKVIKKQGSAKSDLRAATREPQGAYRTSTLQPVRRAVAYRTPRFMRLHHAQMESFFICRDARSMMGCDSK